MNRLAALFLLALGVAGCASKASMDARYDASLQRWRGVTRAELEAAWGPPLQAATVGADTRLTWVVRTDIDNGPGPDGAPVVTVARTGGGGGVSPKVTTVGAGAPAAAAVPITCSTHFTLKEGRVASWTFEGLGCGAPW
jgi:hypothetical protein